MIPRTDHHTNSPEDAATYAGWLADNEDQLAFDLALTEPDYTAAMSLDERFAAFHSANPHVADALERLADNWFAMGNTRCSAKQLTEALRWTSGIRTTCDGGWKLDNSLVSRYARLLIARRPEWSDAFALRRLHDEAA